MVCGGEDTDAPLSVVWCGRIIRWLSTGPLENPLDEIAAMTLLNERGGHPNVLPLLDALQCHDFLYIVTPYLRGGDLFQRMVHGRGVNQAQTPSSSSSSSPSPPAGRAGLGEAQAAAYLTQIVDGLAYMKATGIAHR
jgi:serine/threonine protein kinase